MTNSTQTLKTLVRLPLKTVSNCRDLGGYPTSDNQSVKWRAFLRSNNLVHLSKEDKEYLLDYGLKTVIDLRTPSETIKTPNPLSREDTIDYHNVNLTGREAEGESLKALTEEGIKLEHLLRENYIVMLNNKEKMREVFHIILEAEEGVVLFHCNAGKDRTGLIAMLILGLAGVAEQDIITNYEISLTNIYQDVVHKMTPDYMPILSSTPGNIIKAMTYIKEEFGSYDSYFQRLGFTETDIERLQEKILER